MSLIGAVVSDSWTLVLRSNTARARDIHVRARWVIYWLIVVLTIVLAGIEISSSFFEARLFSAVDRRLTYSLRPGPSGEMGMPAAGPYDQRLGFSDIADFTKRLESRQFEVEAQARTSATSRSLSRLGIFPIYHEPSQAGLRTATAYSGLPA